jgi:D-sedoheptulose 7-phosphate isomerase
MIEQDTTVREEFVLGYFAAIRECLDALSPTVVARFIECLERAYHADGQVFIIGNGGSASTASHMACDLAKNVYPPASARAVRRFRVTSLTDNVALITALANDSGYERIFTEQLQNVLRPGDLVIAISASGNSLNVLEALTLARVTWSTSPWWSNPAITDTSKTCIWC